MCVRLYMSVSMYVCVCVSATRILTICVHLHIRHMAAMPRELVQGAPCQKLLSIQHFVSLAHTNRVEVSAVSDSSRYCDATRQTVEHLNLAGSFF